MKPEEFKLLNLIVKLMRDTSFNISTDFSQEIQSMDENPRLILFAHFERSYFDIDQLLLFHIYCELVRYASSNSQRFEQKVELLWEFIVENFTRENLKREQFDRWAYSEEKTKWAFTHFMKLIKNREDLVTSYGTKCIKELKSRNPSVNFI